MSSKHASICHVTFYDCDNITVNSSFGRPTAKINKTGDGVKLPVVGASLSEIRSEVGNVVDVELVAKITDTSFESEMNLLEASFRYGVLLIDYTDGVKKILGTERTPVILSYEKSGIPASFTLSVIASQPEFSKILL